MNAADNKALMQRIYSGIAEYDNTLFLQHLADDAVWIVTGQYSWSHAFRGREAILGNLLGYVSTRMQGRRRVVAYNYLADGDQVVIETKGDNVTVDGARYDNDYCMVFRLRDGMMVEIKEYCDSTLTETVLGPFPPERIPA